MELCFLFRRNAITTTDINQIQHGLTRLHRLREVFIEAGVRTDISLPRQHALLHYITGITLFGSPNGLCSSITESKHIVAVKRPWRRSSRYKALAQMVCTINRLDKLAALQRVYARQGMLVGTTSAHVAQTLHKCLPRAVGAEGEIKDMRGNGKDYEGSNESDEEDNYRSDDESDEGDIEEDIGPVSGSRALSSVMLASQRGGLVDVLS